MAEEMDDPDAKSGVYGYGCTFFIYRFASIFMQTNFLALPLSLFYSILRMFFLIMFRSAWDMSRTQ